MLIHIVTCCTLGSNAPSRLRPSLAPFPFTVAAAVVVAAVAVAAAAAAAASLLHCYTRPPIARQPPVAALLSPPSLAAASLSLARRNLTGGDDVGLDVSRDPAR